MPNAERRTTRPDAEAATWVSEVGSVQLTGGAGALDRLGPLVRPLGRRVLVFTDASVSAAGHLDRAARALEAAGCEVSADAAAEREPSSDSVHRAVAEARERGPEVLVAVGGGSVMDTVKGVNLVLTNGGSIRDYWGFGKATAPLLPSVAVPTTAGTGSEAQSYALIADADSGRKMACGDRKARFRAAVLDPSLLATTPRGVAAAAALDAMSHALESWVTLAATPVSAAYAREAWRLLDGAVEQHLSRPDAAEAAAAMQLGAHLAGAAIENSMLGAAHAAANPLTARHGVPHGEAVALVLPSVLRYNEPVAGRRYAALAPDGAEALAQRIERLRSAHGMPERLAAVSVQEEEIGPLADAATAEWTASFNPRPLTPTDFRTIYESCI